MDSKRSFEVFLEGEGGNEIMEGFNEFDLNLRSMVMFKKKKIKATYSRRHED